MPVRHCLYAIAFSLLSALAIIPHANAQTTSDTGIGTPTNPTPSVTVTAKPVAVVNKVDRKVYRTDADLQGTTGSASDVLRNIPSVEVDPDGVISLRGDASVSVLIDGKPAASMQGAARGDALLSLPAADIQQIEVMTSPSAEFKAEGSGGVINIVTKKSRKTGGSGTITANMGNEGRYNTNASASYSTGHFRLSGSVGIKRDDRHRTADTQSTSIDSTGGATTNSQHVRQHESRTRGSAEASLEYTPSDKRTLGATLSYAIRRETQSSLEAVEQYGAGHETYTQFGWGAGPRSDINIALRFEQKLARDGENLSFDLQTGQTNESNVYDYTRTFSGPAQIAALQRDSNQEVYGVSDFSAAYVRPFTTGSKLKLGYDIEYDQNAFNNSSQFGEDGTALTLNPALDNLFRYRQIVTAAYATFDKELGKLEVLAGLRFEQTDTSTVQKVSGDMGTQSYGKLYPSLNFVYRLSDQDTLSSGLSNRVTRRDPEDLNPYINAADPNNLHQGNPKLKPEDTTSYELGYRHDAGSQSYQFTGYYHKSRNGDSEIISVVGPGVLLVTEANLPFSQSGGVEIGASGKLMQKLGYTLSGNAFHAEINTQALGSPGTKSNTALNAKGALDYLVTKADRVQISTNYNGKRLTPQGYILPVSTVNLGYRHQFNDKVVFVATISDLFNSQKSKRYFATPTFNGLYERRQYGQIVFVGLVYMFGSSNKSKENNFSYDQ